MLCKQFYCSDKGSQSLFLQCPSECWRPERLQGSTNIIHYLQCQGQSDVTKELVKLGTAPMCLHVTRSPLHIPYCKQLKSGVRTAWE